jgi:hypothetical protein
MKNPTIKTQNFGVEIEMTGITRCEAAQDIADYYGTTSSYLGTYYKTYGATDRKGRTWKAMSDGSIRTERKRNGTKVDAGREYSCEVVTPVLQYDDLEDLQNVVRALRAAGAFANSSCGIHVHVDGANHTPESLTRLLNFAIGRQDLFYEALQIGDRANRWCHKMGRPLFTAMKKATDKSKPDVERMWYSQLNDGYRGRIDHEHYNETRYHGINLHAFFTKGTVEFRLFNGTTHAGKIKAYVQFCLAMSAWAINCENNNLYFKGIAGYTDEQKAAIMKRVLINRLGLSGPEFKTCRLHLTSVWTHAADTDAA